MCSESVWWRCHRRLIADVAVLGRGVPVQHLMPDGRLDPAPAVGGRRARRDGEVRWPAHDYGPGMTRPTAVVVMGVSGSGKTTVAVELARRLGWEFAEGDDHHPPANVEKMRAGTPLTDADREPWLRGLAAWIAEREQAGTSCVLTCSALQAGATATCCGRATSRCSSPTSTSRRRCWPSGSPRAPATTCRRPCSAASWPPSSRSQDDEPGITVPGTGEPADVVDAIVAALPRP